MFGRITNYQGGARNPAPLPPQRNDERVEEDDDEDEAAALLLRPDESDSDSVSQPGSALSDDNDDEGPLHHGSRRAPLLDASFAGETPSARNPQDVDHHAAAAAFQLSSLLLRDEDDDNESPSVVSNANNNNNNNVSPALISTSTHSLRSRTTKDSVPMVHTTTTSTTTTTTSRKSPLRSALPLRRRLGCDEADTEDNDDDNDTHDYMDYDSSCCDDEFIMEARKQPMALRHTNNINNTAIATANNHRLHRWHIFGIPLCCCSLNRMAAFVLWSTIISLAVAVVWYSYELFNHGTDPHKIAWFSAGAFVLLGFPVSMWGILGHLMNYNAPGTQVYIVRILWMVPIYSIQSWLAMRFHKQAVFIETLRDFYESYVLYSFTQFLTQVLGGEEALILMLKDKSPTRGVHMWGLQWCVKPWIMGQPVRRYDDEHLRSSVVERVTAAMTPSSPAAGVTNSRRRRRQRGRVHWKSPFYIKCKFGVLQYVLIKLVCAVAVLLLEYKGWYKEGQFKWSAGYLYICIVTNVSQCWALYCLIFFYYATKTELSPIRPIGKFLSVKMLVFATWWQSVFISVLVQMDLIPNYHADERYWTSDDVAKGIQDYLICMEMFVAAVVHTFVFPHSEYSVAAVNARANAIHPKPAVHPKRLGRKRLNSSDAAAKHQRLQELEQQSVKSLEVEMVSIGSADTWDDRILDDDDAEQTILFDGKQQGDRPGLFRAFMDSAIPRDLTDNTFGMMKGDFNVEKKTLLHHAATSDQYDLFSNRRFASRKKQSATDESVTETTDGGGAGNLDDVL